MNQLGALASFGFSIGAGTFRNCPVRTRLNNGEDPNKVAEEELPKYGWVNPMPTLKETARFLDIALEQSTIRRTDEIELFKKTTFTL